MNPTAVDRIRPELERQELYYEDKQLLAAGKLREVIVNLRERQHIWPGLTLPLRLMVLADVAYAAVVFTDTVDSPFPRWLLITLNLIVLGVHLGSAVHSHLAKGQYDRWLRELDELENATSALSETHA